ncbi:enhancer of rudimentary family protein [Dictyostelium discoideum AX4]|uniref:Enhancer of rudimentary homolog n=1 Tax=Dictyostelium discoideum TaxID=44689 RepID=ERH_DICDI|nr:enhancer of rudimentary family protein [Dictyostelium discoideum AX4]Q86A92.1 RecName: Full=Enhancer of rudimentary homolog [Dictyostelium discoideum]EAL70175.1 enhancer of rudimentary family protein [Dictyostelium discoideum AX4]|eukprot:XP_643968.1 enhancer of rudimentary family protein [Dictyostelium discoideum AX4]
MSHTIVLLQTTMGKSSRTFMDYESVNQAIEGICNMYEQRLKQERPNQKNITYDISQLFKFIDSLADLSCLVYTSHINAYTPYNKEWIKTKIINHLQKLAQ